jgi:hypothetical protein
MAYSKVNWTELIPISAANLATMDTGIYDTEQAIEIVQIVRNSIAPGANTTSSETFVDSTLTATITPLLSDSVLHVFAALAFDYNASNNGYIRLYNKTNTTVLQETPTGAGDYWTSHVGGWVWNGVYTVNSTAAREFLIQYRAFAAADPVAICHTRPGSIWILEVRP